MAQFKYLGEIPRQWVLTYGPCEQLSVPKKDGTNTVLIGPFAIDAVIPFDFTDERSLRVMRNDPRFQEV